MVMAANAPDLDIVSWFGGSAFYLHWHRNITHSLLAAPVMALVAVAIIRVAGRAPLQWLRAWLIALVAVASHLLLDLTNVYGVRVLLPFSGHWFHWDITPVIDVGLWIIILAGVAAPALTRLVGSEIGEKHSTSGNAGWALTALSLFTIYDYGRSLLHDRALAIVDSHVYNGVAARRTAAFPTENPLLWTGTAEIYNAWVQGPVDLRGNFHASDFETFYKGEQTAAVDAATRTPEFRSFLKFVQYPLWQGAPAAGRERGTQVTLYDLRFGNPREPGFLAAANVNDRNEVTESKLSMTGSRPR